MSSDTGTRIGRPVRVVSISFRNKSRELILNLVEREAAKGADLIALPETWLGFSAETLEGPTVTALSALAKRHQTYIVSPIEREDAARRVNSAVLISRSGGIVGVYDKAFPYWSEFDLDPPNAPGEDVPVFDLDFGKVGIAICFDVNFPEMWQRLADRGAELVIWPSAYSAGTSLQAHAINHHYYIVTSTLTRDCLVYDITGKQLLYERSDDINVSRITLDLDRGIYHQNFNMTKREALLRAHGHDVEQDEWLDLEQWFVLRARRPGISARQLAKEFGLEELRDYINRSRRHITALRGCELSTPAARPA